MNIKNLFKKIHNRYTDYKIIKCNIPLISPETDLIYMVDEYERRDNYLNKTEIIQIINPRRKAWYE